MFRVFSCLALLAVSLSVILAKPADVIARVPSSYYQGTKWLLFRDNSIPDPPPNVIQAENGVQVLPTYRYQQPDSYVSQTPVYVPLQLPVQSVQYRVQPGAVTQAPLIVTTQAPVHFESVQKPQFQFGENQIQQQQQQFTQEFQRKVQQIVQTNPVITKVSTYSVTDVPQSAVHVQGPAYFDYLRKKKSA